MPWRQGIRRADRLRRDDHVERLLHTGEPRQALRAFGAGNDPERALGQTKLARLAVATR